jgi:hypothetical protein
MFDLTDEDRALAQSMANRRIAAREAEEQQPKQGGLGSFLLGLLPGGSLIDKGLRGEQITGGDVATEVGLSLVPFGLGKVAKVAKGLIGGGRAARMLGEGSSATMATAVPNRASSMLAGSVETPMSKFSLGGKLQDMGNRALANQYGTISKPVARSTNPTQTVSELAEMGITKPEDAERIASMFTGPDGMVNKAVLKATGNARGVDTSTLRDVFENAIASRGVVDKDAQSLRSVFDSQMERLYGGRMGSLNPLADPDETLSVMKALEKRRADLLGKGGNYKLTTPERGDQAAVLKLVTDEMEDALYRGAGANKNLKSILTPEFRANLTALNPGNAQWEKFIDNKVMGAKDIGELRSSMAPFVRIGKIIDEGETNAMTFGGRAGNAAQMLSGGGAMGAVREAAGNIAAGPVSRIAGNALRTAGKAIDERGTANSVVDSAAAQSGRRMNPLLKFLLPQAGVRLATDTIFPGARQSAPEDQQPTDSPLASVSNTGTEEPSAIYSRDAVARDIQNDLQATGGENMEKYMKLYEFLNAEGGAGSKANATTQKALAQSANADMTLRQLEETLANAGGAGGPVGGGLATFLGGLGFNNNVKTYNDLVGGSTTQIAKALGETGAMSDADRAAYSNLLPKVTDTPQVAAAKFQALRERMAAAQQNTLQYGAGSGVEDALASMGY